MNNSVLLETLKKHNIAQWKLLTKRTIKYISGIQMCESIKEFSTNCMYVIYFIYNGYLGDIIINVNNFDETNFERQFITAMDLALASKRLAYDIDTQDKSLLYNLNIGEHQSDFFTSYDIDANEAENILENNLIWIKREFKSLENSLKIKLYSLFHWKDYTFIELLDSLNQTNNYVVKHDFIGMYGHCNNPIVLTMNNVNVNQSIIDSINLDQLKEQMEKKQTGQIISRLEGKVKFTRKALLSLIQTIITSFYASFIMNQKSFIKLSKLGEQLFDFSFSLIDNPTAENGKYFKPFDDEGNIATIKYLIKDGIINDFLCNMDYAYIIGKDAFGNANIMNKDHLINIEHSNIILEVNRTETDYDLLIDNLTCSFDYMNMTVKGLGYGYVVNNGKNYVCVNIDMDLKKLFSKVYSAGEADWIDFLYTPELILEIAP